MPRPWGPLPLMYLPCPPWAGWYGLWTPPLMHFHPRWSGPPGGFGHGGYHARDGCYRGVSQQQNGKENRMVQNPAPDGPVSPKIAEAPGPQCEQWIHKLEVSVNKLGAIKTKQCRGMNLQLMTKRSTIWRKVQRRL
jgi:hypothetical protein